MSSEIGAGTREFLRMSATAKIEHLKTSKTKQEDESLVAAQIEPGEDERKDGGT